ncbi:MAG: hypothetical protein K0S65_512 [Labilithrix sp.]|nr:hypothetical protein [Labilithrix sp.]
MIPVGVGVILLLLLMPRATAPDAIPFPRTNLRLLADISAADDRRAAEAERERLPTDVLALGSALRVLNGAEARGLDEPGVVDARRQLDGALRDLAQRKDVAPDLVALRALQTRRFLDALVHWEKTGETSEDFLDLAASFVIRAGDAGWLEGRRLILDDTERRVMFKTVWNVLTGLEATPAIALALDEQRALYSFYLRHPRPPESRRLALETQRRAATTSESCVEARAEMARQTELWRAEKIKRLGAIDPSYPTSYALGVAYYRAGRFELAADSFAAFVGQNPDGPYALRARNHLKASLAGGAL